MLRRREFLALPLVGAVAACADKGEDRPVTSQTHTITYGVDPAQFGELTRPAGPVRGVAVILHGGFWRSAYDLSLGRPLVESLVAAGWAAWNLEYRRVGNGGGYPETLDDVAAGIDALAEVEGLELGRVVTIGHSAGGHLAAWAAARGDLQPWSPPRVEVTGVISQAGVLDLRAAAAAGSGAGLGAGAVAAFVGAEPGTDSEEVYALVDPTRQLPLDVPVWCVHGRGDDIVPLSQSADYVARSRAAGGTAELIEVDGDHFVVIDPTSTAWAEVLAILADL